MTEFSIFILLDFHVQQPTQLFFLLFSPYCDQNVYNGISILIFTQFDLFILYHWLWDVDSEAQLHNF